MFRPALEWLTVALVHLIMRFVLNVAAVLVFFLTLIGAMRAKAVSRSRW